MELIPALFDRVRLSGRLLTFRAGGRKIKEGEGDEVLLRASGPLEPIRALCAAFPDFANAELAGLRQPFVYSTYDWPDTAPAGYVGPESGVGWSDAIASALAMWNLELNHPGVARLRVLRAALYLTDLKGKDAAIDFLFDLARSGLLIRPDTLGFVVNALLQGIAAFGEKEAWRICAPARPGGHKAWMDMGPPDLRDLSKDPAFLELLSGYLMKAYEGCVAAREAKTSDDWLIAQTLIYTLARSTKFIREVYGISYGLSLQSIDDDLEEFQADAGAVILGARDAMDYDQFPFQVRFTMAQVVDIMFRGRDGHDAMLDRRILLPDLFRDIWSARDSHSADIADAADRLSPGWRILSPRIAPSYGAIALEMPGVVMSYTTSWPPPSVSEADAPSGMVAEWLEASLPSPVLRRIVWLRLAGRFDEIGAILREEVHTPPKRDDKDYDRALWAFCLLTLDLDAMKALCDREKTSTADLVTGTDHAYTLCNYLEYRPLLERLIRLGDAGDAEGEAVAARISKTWPYLAQAYSERAILLDKLGRTREAMDSVADAILIEPGEPLFWHSAAVIAAKLPGDENRPMIYAMTSAVLTRRKENARASKPS